MWRPVVWLIGTNISKQHTASIHNYLEDGLSRLLRHICTYVPNWTVSHPKYCISICGRKKLKPQDRQINECTAQRSNLEAPNYVRNYLHCRRTGFWAVLVDSATRLLMYLYHFDEDRYIIRDFFSVRLSVQGVSCHQRCFRQRIQRNKISLHGMCWVLY